MPKVKPCPECEKRAGWEPMGPYRVVCMGCGALVKNGEAFDDGGPRHAPSGKDRP